MLVLLGERHEREHHVTDAALSLCDVKAVYTLCARHAHQEDGWPALVKVIYCIIIFIWPCTLCYLFFCSPAIFSRTCIAILLYWTNNRKREIDNWNAGCKWLMIWMDASESHDTLRCQWGPQNVLTMLCKDIGASDDSRYLALSRYRRDGWTCRLGWQDDSGHYWQKVVPWWQLHGLQFYCSMGTAWTLLHFTSLWKTFLNTNF